MQGVPQGSLLGLFTYGNDFPNYINNTCVLFADDTTVFNVDKA